VHDTPLDQLPGSRANKDKRTLAAFPRRDLTKHIGTEFHDASLQLSKLTDQQVQDLALLVAERGVVFFRQQDLTQDQQLALVRKLGPLHIHPVGWSDGENPEVQTLNFGPHSTGVVGEGWVSSVASRKRNGCLTTLF
jgi:alpha-ketoglutarate-dependent taurine dioxygenase